MQTNFPDVKKISFFKQRYQLRYGSDNFYLLIKKITPFKTNGIINIISDSDIISARIDKKRLYITFNKDFNDTTSTINLTFQNKANNLIGKVTLDISVNKEILTDAISLLSAKMKSVTKTDNEDPLANRFDKLFLHTSYYEQFQHDILTAQEVYKNTKSTQRDINKQVTILNNDITLYENKIFKGEKVITINQTQQLIVGLSFGGFLFLSILFILLVFYFFNRNKNKGKK